MSCSPSTIRETSRQSLRLSESLLSKLFIVSTIYQLCNRANPFRRRKIGLWAVCQTGSGNIKIIPLLQKLKDLITFACVPVLVFVWAALKIFRFRIHKYLWGTFMFSLFFLHWYAMAAFPYHLSTRTTSSPSTANSPKSSDSGIPRVGLEVLYLPQFQTPLIPQWFVSIRFWCSPKTASVSPCNDPLSLSVTLSVCVCVCVCVKLGLWPHGKNILL